MNYKNILLELSEIFKHMKCTEVWIYKNETVYGFDETNATFISCDIRHIDLPIQFTNVLFNAKDFSKIIKGSEPYEIVGDFDNRFVITNGVDNCLIFNPNYSPLFSTFYKALCDVSNFIVPKFIIKNFNKNENYQKYFDLKANDGIIKFNLEGYPIVMYNKIIPSNKSDKVDIEIFDDNSNNHFFVRYIVNKKKNITIYVWTCYLKI